ncbi:MAG: glycosyltransferase family 39 protein [Candidatus Eiseniibacteriota bacterium]
MANPDVPRPRSWNRAMLERLLLPWAIAVFAFLIRISHLRWGLPEVEEEAHPVRKAFEMWGWDEGRLTLDPQTAGWPALSFYVHLALQHAQYAVGRMTGRYEDRLDFFMEHVDVHTLMVPARFLSVVMAVAVVFVGVRLAQRLAGWFGALVTGLTLSLSPLLLEVSLEVTPDMFATVFSALALAGFLDVYERGRLRDYLASGAWIGLGVASKYTPILLVPCLLAAHVARHWNGGRWRSLLHRRLLAAGAGCAATFCAASPFTLMNFAATQRDVASQFSHVVTAGHFGHELQGSGYVSYLVNTLPAALGWPGLVLGLSGLALAAVRRGGAWLIIALAFACYYLGLGALRSLHEHYILPLLLPLALGLAGLTGEPGRMRWAHRGRVAVALAAGFLAVVLIPVGVGSARQQVRYSRPSTTREAKSFLMEELYRPDAYFACELAGPDLPRHPAAEFSRRPVFARLDEQSRQRLLSRPFVNRYYINMYMTDANGADIFYDLRHYLCYDYIIVVGGAYHRYTGLAQDFPRQNEFYRDLELYCEPVRRFAASPERLGPDVWIWAVRPETRRILEDRGRLARGFHLAHMDKVRPDDLHAFLGFTGDLAARREDWQSADLYLSTFLDLRPDIRGELLLTVAHAKYQAGDLAGAAELCAERLQLRPGDPQAVALGAAIVREAEGAAIVREAGGQAERRSPDDAP